MGTNSKFTLMLFFLCSLSTTPPPAAPAPTVMTLTMTDQNGPKTGRARDVAASPTASPLR